MANQKVRYQGSGLSDPGKPWNVPTTKPAGLTPVPGGGWGQYYPDRDVQIRAITSALNPYKPGSGGTGGGGTISNTRNKYVANRLGEGADAAAIERANREAWMGLQKQRSTETANKRVTYLKAREGQGGALGYGDVGAGAGLSDPNAAWNKTTSKYWMNDGYAGMGDLQLFNRYQELLNEQTGDGDGGTGGGGGGYYGGGYGRYGGGGGRGGYNPYAWYFSLLNWRI